MTGSESRSRPLRGWALRVGADMKVTAAFRDGPAARAGLSAGDTLVAIGGLKATPERVATTLARGPEMRLLDEPTAGMAHEDVGRITALIRRVAANRTVLMVEHNLSVVSTLSDRITVLARGEILAEGDYATVSRHPAVVEAYLGASHG